MEARWQDVMIKSWQREKSRQAGVGCSVQELGAKGRREMRQELEGDNGSREVFLGMVETVACLKAEGNDLGSASQTKEMRLNYSTCSLLDPPALTTSSLSGRLVRCQPWEAASQQQ